jgi:hypothetical protein
MAQKKLDLFKLASVLMAKPGTGSTQIVRSDHSDTGVHSRFANDGPNYLRSEPLTLNLSGLVYGAEEYSVL